MGKSLLTKELQAQIVEILEAGNYQKTAYESLGIPKATYYDWLKEGERAESITRNDEGFLTKKEKVYLDFSDTIKKAVQKARQVNLAVIRKAAEKGNWQAAAWFLERTDFEHFGNKSKFEHTGKDGKPVTIIVEYEDGPKTKS